MAGGRPFARRSMGSGRVCPGSARPFPAVGISSSEGSSRAGGLLGPGLSSWPGLRASCCHPSLTRLLVLKRSFNLRDGPFQQHAYTHLKMAESNFFSRKIDVKQMSPGGVLAEVWATKDCSGRVSRPQKLTVSCRDGAWQRAQRRGKRAQCH